MAPRADNIDRAGQAFPDSPAETESGDADRRRHPRRSVLWPAVLETGRHRFDCHILNLSLSGARIRLDLPLRDGAAVTLHVLGRGEIPALVVWCGEDSLGLDFGLPPAQVRAMFRDTLETLGLT